MPCEQRVPDERADIEGLAMHSLHWEESTPLGVRQFVDEGYSQCSTYSFGGHYDDRHRHGHGAGGHGNGSR